MNSKMLDVSTIKFSYMNRVINKRDKNGNPIKPVPCITICYYKDPQNDILCRGIAVCSEHQEGGFEYRQGRNKALGRAIKAMINKVDAYPIKRLEGVIMLNHCGIKMFVNDGCFHMKSKYNVTLNDALNSDDYKIIADLLSINVQENKYTCG